MNFGISRSYYELQGFSYTKTKMITVTQTIFETSNIKGSSTCNISFFFFLGKGSSSSSNSTTTTPLISSNNSTAVLAVAAVIMVVIVVMIDSN